MLFKNYSIKFNAHFKSNLSLAQTNKNNNLTIIISKVARSIIFECRLNRSIIKCGINLFENKIENYCKKIK